MAFINNNLSRSVQHSHLKLCPTKRFLLCFPFKHLISFMTVKLLQTSGPVVFLVVLYILWKPKQTLANIYLISHQSPKI